MEGGRNNDSDVREICYWRSRLGGNRTDSPTAVCNSWPDLCLPCNLQAPTFHGMLAFQQRHASDRCCKMVRAWGGRKAMQHVSEDKKEQR